MKLLAACVRREDFVLALCFDEAANPQTGTIALCDVKTRNSAHTAMLLCIVSLSNTMVGDEGVVAVC